MLIALIFLYTNRVAALTYPDLAQAAAVGPGADPTVLAFFAAFAVKVPMWPVHTWLPDVHVEAPTAVRPCWRPSC